jgi:hypothetical protein
VDRQGDGWHIAAVPAPNDPRYRKYRASLWVIYFGAIALGVGILIFSVARHLRGPRRISSGPPPTRAALRVCLGDLEALFHEQNQQAWVLASELERTAPFRRWQEWSAGWEKRVDDMSDRCGLDADDPHQAGFAERGEMAAARDAMRALHRAYEQSVSRFAAEHGDLVQAASESRAPPRVAGGRAP